MFYLSRLLICTEPHVLHIILRVQTNNTSLAYMALHENSRDDFPTLGENKAIWLRVLSLCMIGLLVVVLYTCPELLTLIPYSLFLFLFFGMVFLFFRGLLEGLGISCHLYDLDWHVMLCFHLFLISALLAHLFSFCFSFLYFQLNSVFHSFFELSCRWWSLDVDVVGKRC